MLNQKPFWFEEMSQSEAQRWHRPWVAITTVGICAVLFALQSFIPPLPLYEFFYFSIPQSWFEGYRLLTPIFLHFSILHIAFNTAIFWFFGRQIETLLGRSVLFWLVVCIGIFSNLGQFFAQGAQFGGLSGVVMGVISFVWLASKQSTHIRFFMPNGLMAFVILTLMLGFAGVLDQFLGPIANVAHALGFVGGLLLWPLVALLHQK